MGAALSVITMVVVTVIALIIQVSFGRVRRVQP
jgi:hypothetical protein